MSRTSALGQWTGLPVLADGPPDITAVGTTMADNIEKQVNLRFASTAARDSAISSPVRGMVAYIDADNIRYIYTGSVWTPLNGPAHGAWTTFVPTLTQSGAVTNTTTYAAYARESRLITGSLRLAITGTGSAGVVVVIGLPVAAAATVTGCIGSGYITDASAGPIVYSGMAFLNTTTTAVIYGGGGVANALGVTQFTAALASGDSLSISFNYEAAAD